MRTIILALTLAALALSVNAAFDVEATSFVETPVKVLTKAADAKNFKAPWVTRYINETYVCVWGFFADGETAPVTWNANRRLLFADNMTVNGNDTVTEYNITLDSTPFYAYSTDGFVAVGGTIKRTETTTTETAEAENSTNSTNETAAANETAFIQMTANTTTTTVTHNVEVTVFSSDLEDAHEAQVVTLDSTSNETLGFNMQALWFEEDYFYVAYTSVVSKVDSALFVNAFKRNGGKQKWTGPIQINTQDLSGNLNLQINQHGNTIVASWRLDTQNQVVAVTVDAGSGDVSEEVVLATDSGDAKFAPGAIVWSEEYYAVVVNKQTGGESTTFTVSFSSGNVTGDLGFALEKGYTGFSVSAHDNFYDGWFVITRETTKTGNAVTATQESLHLYNYTQTTETEVAEDNSTNATNSTNETAAANETAFIQMTTTSTIKTEFVLVNDGAVLQGFTLPNQSYFVVVADSVTGGDWNDVYIGQVFAKISDHAFGAVMKATFALMTTLIALLFAF